ncbi:hypothetical protein MBLNU459_g6767t1 [Dothideomycetes sp. NU459]
MLNMMRLVLLTFGAVSFGVWVGQQSPGVGITGVMASRVPNTNVTIKTAMSFQFEQLLADYHKFKLDLVNAELINDNSMFQTSFASNATETGPINDTCWESASKKGLHLVQILNADVTGAINMLRSMHPSLITTQSPWTDQADLEANGWTSEDLTADMGAHNAPYDILVHREMFGLAPFQKTPRGEAPLSIMQTLQKHDAEIDGKHYQASNPYIVPYVLFLIFYYTLFTVLISYIQASHVNYTNVYNVQHGSIVVLSGLSPAYTMEKESSAVVPLQGWGDVTFLEWKRQAGNDVSKLKHVWALDIHDATTQSIIARALQGRTTSLQKLPGYNFHWGSSEGRAILASPVGRDIAWMLIQHKLQFGIKRFAQVTVFQNGDSNLPSLRFWFT